MQTWIAATFACFNKRLPYQLPTEDFLYVWSLSMLTLLSCFLLYFCCCLFVYSSWARGKGMTVGFCSLDYIFSKVWLLSFPHLCPCISDRAWHQLIRFFSRCISQGKELAIWLQMISKIKNKKHWRQIPISPWKSQSDLQEITQLNKSMEGSKSKALPNKIKY